MMDPFNLILNLNRCDDNLIQGSEELNSAIDHIIQLLKDSTALYIKGSFATSAFVSISACEEIAKANIGILSDGQNLEKKNHNVFRDHRIKHLLSAMPTVSMGNRIKKALGKQELERIINMAQNSGFVKIREDALYFQRENGKLVTPIQKIDQNLSKSLLLFALEVFDDALVGYTNYSMEIDAQTNGLFEQIVNL